MAPRLNLILCLMPMILATACGSRLLHLPGSMVPLEVADNSDERILQAFPGTAGEVCTETERTETPAAGFGVVQDQQEPYQTYLVGVGRNHNWKQPLPVEPTGMRVTQASVEEMYLGDMRKDGVPELFLALATQAEKVGDGRANTRVSVYAFELGDPPRLILYKTLSLEETVDNACTSGFINYQAAADVQTDGKGAIEALDVEFSMVQKYCTRGDTCHEAKSCQRDNDRGSLRLIYDETLGVFRPETEDSLKIVIPDISL